jgi:hypothetical protein
MPFGPFLVGLGASTGFIAGMWLTHLRPRKSTMVIVALALVAAYFAAEYLEFRRLNPVGTVDEDGLPVTFWWFYDASTRNISTSPASWAAGSWERC